MKHVTLIFLSLLSSIGGCFAVEQRAPSAASRELSLLSPLQASRSTAPRQGAVLPTTARVLSVKEFARAKDQTPAREIAVSVQIHPSLSNYVLRLIPAPVDRPERGLQPVGRIEISKNPSGPVFQAINVTAEASTGFFIPCVEFVDINHDGYLDLMTLAEFGGAKWGRYQYWVFDPGSGRFVANWLTKKLSRFQCNEILPDSRSGELHVRYLVLDGVMDEGYRIQGRRLVLVSKVEIAPRAKGGFTVTTKRLTNGKMRVVKVEQVSDYP